MAHLHLPAQHSDHDLAIAGTLAQVLRSHELYVAWSTESGDAGTLAQVLRSHELYVAWSTESGAGEPVIPAMLHTTGEAVAAPPARSRSLLARLFDGFRRTA